MSPVDPAKRQILVNLGNRFVVFGPEGALPEPIHFDPADSPILPRVADEGEVAGARIAETLQVSGMMRTDPAPDNARDADIELVDPNGRRILVDVKVRERDPRQRDIDPGMDRLKLAKDKGRDLEIWFFNIERLKLTVMRLHGSALHFDYLVPLNIWERTPEGIFERQRVVVAVDEWLSRIERLYAEIRQWLVERSDLRFEQTRTVTMSEEMMQQFAVTDKELAILDVLCGDRVVVSFVPRGLWLIGAWGRIDIITQDATWILVANKNLEWLLASPADRRQVRPFDKALLLELMGGQ